jgi:hypothetical protein
MTIIYKSMARTAAPAIAATEAPILVAEDSSKGGVVGTTGTEVLAGGTITPVEATG